MPEDGPMQAHTHRDGINLMPWHIPAGDDGLLRDSILVATMDGNEMLTISLHVAAGPNPLALPRDAASSQAEN